MISKDQLRKDFSRKPDRYYKTKVFEENGFLRKVCSLCGKSFWTTDDSRELCGDPEHEPYTFMKETPIDVEYESFWKKFSDFFKKEGHAVIEKYPVVSRWRQDLYFTIASIQDFQRIENGKMSFEYPSNPLVVPQICLRFNDIPNAGITGRHFTSFMMAGQHSFDYPKEGYWRDKTMELNFNFLTKVLGVRKKNLTYIEDVWAMGDFSEFGPCLESFSNGLEIVNSVFTEFEFTHGQIKELDNKVIDVGWGFERLMWFYSGTQTAYDAVFRRELEYLYKSTGVKPNAKLYSKVAGSLGGIDMSEERNAAEHEKMLVERAGISPKEYENTIKPMQALYAISDHARTLLFAISDGALPSNVGGGYNLRIILRRIFDFTSKYSLDFDLMKLVELEGKHLKNLYPGIDESYEEMSKIFALEKTRYEATKKTAGKLVTDIIEKREKLTPKRMATLYESNGITPEFIESVAKSKKVEIELPEAYMDMIKGDFTKKEKPQKMPEINVEGMPHTVKLFYDFAESSVSKVLKSQGDLVVLDKTPFYAESGGQEADHGYIDGVRVIDVQNVNGTIVHKLNKKHSLKEGQKVECGVDVKRRIRLMAHHTATHLISAAARKVLGPHAWQEGAKKSQNKAHIDISHYERLSEQQLHEIEDTANGFILNGIKVDMLEMERDDAEGQFGFAIYQGKGVPAKKLRIIKITDLQGNLIDAEACGGLHLKDRESIIGLIKIINASRIHDGIDRIEFVAGPAAVEHIKAMEDKIAHVVGETGIDADKLIEGISARVKEMKEYRKEAESLKQKLGEFIAAGLLEKKTADNQLMEKVDLDRRSLRSVAAKYINSKPKATILLYNGNFEAVCASGKESKINALEFLQEKAKTHFKLQFAGGGSAKVAEGKMLPN